MSAIFCEVYPMNPFSSNGASIGIIGGSDGPTAIFVTGRFSWYLPVLIVAGIAALVGLLIWYFKKKR